MSDENLRPGDLLVHRSATLQGVDFSERIIELLAVPYHQETIVGDGPGPIRELVETGAFRGLSVDRIITANREHEKSRTFGKIVEVDTEDPRGLVAHVRASETPLGDETLVLAHDKVLAPSVEMVVRRQDMFIQRASEAGGLALRRIHRAFLQGLALLPDPAYLGAGVLSVRSGSTASTEPTEPPSTPEIDGVLERMYALYPNWPSLT